MTLLRKSAQAICAVLFAIAVAGCGSSSAAPTPTPIPDPMEIVTRSITGLATATTLHVDGVLSGSVNAGALGALMGGSYGGLSGQIKVDGASMTGDADMTKQALHLSATFPSLVGISADMFVVDGYLYSKVNAPGAKYQKTKVSGSLLTASAAPDATFGFTDTLNQLKARLATPGVTAKLEGHESVDGRDAYHLTLTVPADVLNQEINAAGGAAASGADLTMDPIDYWVYVDTVVPAKLHAKASSATLGNVSVTLTLTKYGQAVTIQAPAEDQVSG
jgi:hypothetical protein